MPQFELTCNAPLKSPLVQTNMEWTSRLDQKLIRFKPIWNGAFSNTLIGTDLERKWNEAYWNTPV